jgi:peptidoglycan/LPS O-acetylase OafA/YrhL
VNDGGLGWRAGHFWSLSVEEHFYLFWPALLIVFGVRKGWRTAAAAAVAICIWRVLDDRFQILAGLFHNPFLAKDSFRTDLVADTLLWGCCLAFFLRPPLHRSLGSVRSTLIATGSVGFFVAIRELQVNHVTFLDHLLPTVFLGAVVAAPNAPIGRFLELPPLRFVGKLSYSLYIWQQLFLDGPGRRLPLILALPAILACALFSYEVIERPCIRFGRRLLHRGTISASHNEAALFETGAEPDAT